MSAAVPAGITPTPFTASGSGPGDRLVLLDVLRGLAILGILWRNIFVFGMPYLAYAFLSVLPSETAADRLTQIFVSVFAEGTMRAIISMVFGAAALLIMTAPAQGADPFASVDRYYRRLLWLAAFGLVHAYLLLWPHDILFLYGVLGLVLFPFRNMAPRSLAVLALVLLAFSTVIEGSGWRQVGNAFDAAPEEAALQAPVVLASVGADTDAGSLPELDPQGVPEEVVVAIGEEILQRLSGYAENFRLLAADSLEQQTTELLTHHILDITSMMFLGMALLKWGVLSGRAAPGTYRRLALWGGLAGVVFGVIAHDSIIGFEPLVDFSLDWGDYFFEVRRLAFALAVVGAMGWLTTAGRLPALRAWLADAGRMALTLYVMQTVLCIFLFYGFGLGLFGALSATALLVLAFVINGAQLVFARLWMARFGKGPLERLIAWLIAWTPRAGAAAGEGQGARNH